MTDLVPITDQEIVIYLLKEIADEEVAKKFIVEFRMAGYQATKTIEDGFKRIMFVSHGYIIQNYIDLYPGSFSTTINSEVKEYPYSVENIESVFNEICSENDLWEEDNLIVQVRRVGEDEED
jgi:hypothetical protein